MGNDKLKGFIEVLIPITVCNFKCHYCYVIQRDNRTNDQGIVNHTPTEIRNALSINRLGGVFYISLCGAGETMLVKNLAEIVKNLLEEGHYLNVTTNGTVSKAFDHFFEIIPKDLLPHLNFSFSFHYLELVRLKQMDRFWDNIAKVREHGCSFVLQINLCDEYIPHWDEIKRLSIEHVGAPPQVAATRKENNLENDVELFTNLSRQEYESKGREFDSPLFDFTMRNFMVKRNEFCYAGKWNFVLNLQTGIMRPCYCSLSHVNIYKNPNQKIKFHPVGKHCQSPFCMNSSHFIALGSMPGYKDAPSYGDLRNRKCPDGSEWYSPQFKQFVTQKLYDNNQSEYSSAGVWFQSTKDLFMRTAMRYIPKQLIKKFKNKYKN